MKRKKKRDEILTKEFAERLKQLIGGAQLTEVEKKLNHVVAYKTLWDYVNGLSMPMPDVLMKIARAYGVSVDYLLTGQQNLFNETERKMFVKMKEAEKLGVAEQVEKYMDFLIAQKKQTEANPGMAGQASQGN